VVQVATSVEVEQRSLGRGGGVVTLGLGVADSLDSGIEAVDIGLVVLGVVELHDLARDVRLKGTIVICTRSIVVSSGKPGFIDWLAVAHKGDRGA
jgi:hypothetical protein